MQTTFQSMLLSHSLPDSVQYHLQGMPVVAGNRSSKWDACRAKATRLEYCLRDNNYRPIDCAPEILDLKECCQLHEAGSSFSLFAATEQITAAYLLSTPAVQEIAECQSCLLMMTL